MLTLKNIECVGTLTIFIFNWRLLKVTFFILKVYGLLSSFSWKLHTPSYYNIKSGRSTHIRSCLHKKIWSVYLVTFNLLVAELESERFFDTTSHFNACLICNKMFNDHHLNQLFCILATSSVTYFIIRCLSFQVLWTCFMNAIPRIFYDFQISNDKWFFKNIICSD